MHTLQRTAMQMLPVCPRASPPGPTAHLCSEPVSVRDREPKSALTPGSGEAGEGEKGVGGGTQHPARRSSFGLQGQRPGP